METNPYESPQQPPAGGAEPPRPPRKPWSGAKFFGMTCLAVVITTIVTTLAAASPLPGVGVALVAIAIIGWWLFAEWGYRRRHRGQMARALGESRPMARGMAAFLLITLAAPVAFFCTCTTTLLADISRKGPEDDLTIILSSATVAAVATVALVLALRANSDG